MNDLWHFLLRLLLLLLFLLLLLKKNEFIDFLFIMSHVLVETRVADISHENGFDG